MKTILLTTLLILTACAPESEKAKTSVRISLPSASTQGGLRHYRPKGQFGLGDMTTVDDSDCYAILYESSGFSPGQCMSGGVAVANALEVYGSFAAGSTVEIEVPQGTGVTFHLIGFSYSGAGSCPDYKTFPLSAQTAASKGVLMDSVITDVQGESLSIQMEREMGPVIETCQNLPFDWEGSGTAIWDVAVWDQATWGP